MQTPKLTEAQAREAHKKRLLSAGPQRGRVVELTEGISPKGNETFRAVLSLLDADGTEHRLIDVAIITDYAPVPASTVTALRSVG